MDHKKLQMRGIVGLYAANSVGDDIEIYEDDSRSQVLCRWGTCLTGLPVLASCCTAPSVCFVKSLTKDARAHFNTISFAQTC